MLSVFDDVPVLRPRTNKYLNMLYIHDKKIFKVFLHMKPEDEEGELNVMDFEARTQINPWQATTVHSLRLKRLLKQISCQLPSFIWLTWALICSALSM